MSVVQEDGLLQPAELLLLTVGLLSSGVRTASLTSVELQMLTSSCVKLQKIHRMPLSISREGISAEVESAPLDEAASGKNRSFSTEAGESEVPT